MPAPCRWHLWLFIQVSLLLFLLYSNLITLHFQCFLGAGSNNRVSDPKELSTCEWLLYSLCCTWSVDGCTGSSYLSHVRCCSPGFLNAALFLNLLFFSVSCLYSKSSPVFFTLFLLLLAYLGIIQIRVQSIQPLSPSPNWVSLPVLLWAFSLSSFSHLAPASILALLLSCATLSSFLSHFIRLSIILHQLSLFCCMEILPWKSKLKWWSWLLRCCLPVETRWGDMIWA